MDKNLPKTLALEMSQLSKCLAFRKFLKRFRLISDSE